jgi:glycosyltransferase involved in cell wall biosynthesis
MLDRRDGPALRRLDDQFISHDPLELRLFAVVRDEALRLPALLQYYAHRGVARFFVVDNDSTDGTTDLLLSTPAVHVFRASGRYSQSHFGLTWVRSLLDAYGRNHWCIVVDADEFLVYPGWEHLSMQELCAYLDSESSSAFAALLLDMYSDASICQTQYRAGTDPLTVCPYFDTDTITCVGRWPQLLGGREMHAGGMRKRVFGIEVNLDKVCLFKYRPSMRLHEGMHALGGANFSRAEGAVLHFKYLLDFGDRARIEAMRQEHWENALEYKGYAEIMSGRPDLAAYTDASAVFKHSNDLVRYNIMKSTEDLDRVIRMRRGLGR